MFAAQLDLSTVSRALELNILLRLAAAAALGAAVGLEREAHGKQAGLRTHTLICLGAALLTVMSMRIPGPYAAAYHAGDVSRIAAGVVTGIGFLGAGVILQSRGEVHGLTTAATIWVVSAIGIAAGAGEYVLALGTTALVLIVLVPLRWWERRRPRPGVPAAAGRPPRRPPPPHDDA